MSAFETIDIAKQRAKQKAARAAQKQAGVYINSYTETKNLVLVKDEVVAVTCGILSIVDVKYDVKPLDNANGFLIRATVKAQIDTDDVNKYLNMSAQEKSAIVIQNKELQAAVAAQDEQISTLKAQIKRLTAEGKLNSKREREKISQEVAAEDKIFQSNLKLEEAQKEFYNRNYEASIKLCDEAVSLNPKNARAYGVLNQPQKTIEDCTKAVELDPTFAQACNNRGGTLLFLGNGAQALSDLNKAIELEPKLDLAYANRGLYYFSTKNFSSAVKDFDKAIELNPRLAAACHFRAMAHQAQGDSAKAQADFQKARELGYRG